MSFPDWRALVARHARGARVDLAPQTLDELAAHLEDLYAAALDRGATERDAYRQTAAALESSGIAVLQSEPRRDPRRRRAGDANDTASANRQRSLAMIYALRMALRQFRHHPAFALLTVVVLGLGTGAAAVVYTIVDTVVLRPLPYRAPDRLVALWDANHEKGLPKEPLSPVTFMDYRDMKVFESAAAWWRPDINLTDPGLDPVRIKTVETSGNLFDVLGVGPQLGPGFPKDGPFFHPTELVIVISDRLWRTRYHADPLLVGRQLQLNGTPHTVVGIMPPGFQYPDVDVWQRLRWDLTQHSRHAHFMEGVARLAPGATLEQARSQAASLAARLGAEFEASNKAWAFQLVPLLNDQLGYYRPALLVLFGAVGLLLVIACLNVASLLLTRALAREREIVVRTALGASPRQLVTQLLAESLVLSIAGSLAGLAVATLALPVIVALTPVEIPRLADATVSGGVLLFALGVVGATTILFGLVPSVVLLRRHLGTALRSGDRASSRGARHLYQGLVVAEVAFACALLVSSVLLVRTVRHMTTVPLGIDADAVVVTSIQLSGPAYRDWSRTATVHGQLLARIREQPGIEAAGAGNFLPLEAGWRTPFGIEGMPRPARLEDLPQAQYHSVSEGYFETLGARIRDGRLFTTRDDATSAGVVVVNDVFVKRYLPRGWAPGTVLTTGATGIGPLGSNLMVPARPPAAAGQQLPPAVMRFDIVGVVADVQNQALGQPVEPAVYFTARQFPFQAMFLAIRATDTPTAVNAAKRALQELTPAVPLGNVQTWGERFRSRTAEPRLLMTVLSSFGVLAGFLAALGVYGLFSWSVALRRRELAIRLTLGARPVAIGGLIVGQGVRLVACGLVAGWLIVVAAHRVLETVLFEISPSDPSATVSAALVLLIASLVACLPPAIRAMRVDPVDGLRAE